MSEPNDYCSAPLIFLRGPVHSQFLRITRVFDRFNLGFAKRLIPSSFKGAPETRSELSPMCSLSFYCLFSYAFHHWRKKNVRFWFLSGTIELSEGRDFLVVIDRSACQKSSFTLKGAVDLLAPEVVYHAF